MRPNPLVCLVLVLAAPAAFADESMRCGKWVVNSEMGVEELVKKCGQPKSKEIETTEIRRPNANGVGTFVIGTSVTELWIYKRTPGAIPMLVTIVDGDVKSIEQAE